MKLKQRSRRTSSHLVSECVVVVDANAELVAVVKLSSSKWTNASGGVDAGVQKTVETDVKK